MCTSLAGIRAHRARPQHSPGVICGKAGGAAPAWGSQPGLCLAFIFNTLLPGGDKPSLSEVIAN